MFNNLGILRDLALVDPNVDQSAAFEKRLYICTPLSARLICRSGPADLREEIFCTARNSY